MTSRPAVAAAFATDATLLGGPQVGLAPRLDPGAGVRGQGWYEGRRLGARALSYLLGLIGDWTQYLDQSRVIAQRYWPMRFVISNSAAAASDTPICWSEAVGTYAVPPSGTGFYACVAADAGSSYFSRDGGSWSTQGSYSSVLVTYAFDLASGQVSGQSGLLLSSSTSTRLAKSLDGGASWTLVGTVVPVASVLCYAPSIGGGAGIWVACGAAGAISTSADGITWTVRSVPGGWTSSSGGAKRIVWNGTRFTILPHNAYNNVLTSLDGGTWGLAALTASDTWSGLAWSSTLGQWLATAATTVNKSTDGLTWTLVTTTGFQGGYPDLAVLGNIWVAPTSGGIQWSDDGGVTWQSVAIGEHNTSNFTRIIAADSCFVAVQANGTQLQFATSLRAG